MSRPRKSAEFVVQLKVAPASPDATGTRVVKQINIDELLETEVGPLGLWQWFLVVLGIFSTTASSSLPVFTDTQPLKRCKLDQHTEDVIAASNWNFSYVGFVTGGWNDLGAKDSSSAGCHMYKNWFEHINATTNNWPLSNLSLDTIPCDEAGYVYQYLPFQYDGSIVADFDLVCDRVWLLPIGTSIFMLGMMTGYVAGGFWGGKFGIKNALICFSILELVSSALCSASHAFWLFTLLRFFDSVGCFGKLSAFNLIILDITVSRYRSIVSAIYLVGYNVTSRALLSLFAWLLRDWRWLNLAATSHCLLTVCYFFIIPESPRWLLAQKRSVDALQVLRRGRQINGLLQQDKKDKSEKIDVLYRQEFRRPSIAHVSIYELNRALHRVITPAPTNILSKLLSDRKLVKTTLVSTVLFFEFSFLFIGCLLYTRMIREAVYMVSFYIALAGIPGLLIAMIAYRVVKYRRLPLVFTFAFMSVVLLFGGVYTYIVEPEEDVALTSTVIIAFMLTITTQCMMYIYIPELYPSEIRAQGFGLSAGLGRLGSAISTFINQLDTTLAHGIPIIIYGAVAITSTALTLCLPDTTGEEQIEQDESVSELSVSDF